MIKIQKVFEGDPHDPEVKKKYPADGYEISFEYEDCEIGIYIRLSDLASFALSDADITEVDSWREGG